MLLQLSLCSLVQVFCRDILFTVHESTRFLLACCAPVNVALIGSHVGLHFVLDPRPLLARFLMARVPLIILVLLINRFHVFTAFLFRQMPLLGSMRCALGLGAHQISLGNMFLVGFVWSDVLQWMVLDWNGGPVLSFFYHGFIVPGLDILLDRHHYGWADLPLQTPIYNLFHFQIIYFILAHVLALVSAFACFLIHIMLLPSILLSFKRSLHIRF